MQEMLFDSFDPRFKQYTSRLANEAALKYQDDNYSDMSRDYSKYDWYIWPYPNGTNSFYTTDQREEADLDQCLYSSLFRMPTMASNYALGHKEWSYVAFETGVICEDLSTYAVFESINADHSRQSDINCLCDELGNCYYSHTCRDWYHQQMNNLDCKPISV